MLNNLILKYNSLLGKDHLWEAIVDIVNKATAKQSMIIIKISNCFGIGCIKQKHQGMMRIKYANTTDKLIIKRNSEIIKDDHKGREISFLLFILLLNKC